MESQAMPPEFTPRIDILPTTQRQLWDELGAVPEGFVLYGGTAIALHLGHRISVDFDFFARYAFDPDDLLASVSFLQEAEVVQRDVNTLTCIVDRGGPVQVSFFGVPRLPRLGASHVLTDPGIEIAPLVDLAGTKAAVVQKRAEPKDYIDLDALIRHGVGLDVALAAATLLYGATFNPQVTLKALTWFGERQLADLPDDVRARLMDAVRAVDLDKLPSLTSRGTAL